MTSPSRRKHPITRWSARLATSPSLAALLAIILWPSPAFAQQGVPPKFVRPPQFSPPVHASPSNNPRPIPVPAPSVADGTVQHAGGMQDFAEPHARNIPALDTAPGQWRTRPNELPPLTNQEMRSQSGSRNWSAPMRAPTQTPNSLPAMREQAPPAGTDERGAGAAAQFDNWSLPANSSVQQDAPPRLPERSVLVQPGQNTDQPVNQLRAEPRRAVVNSPAVREPNALEARFRSRQETTPLEQEQLDPAAPRRQKSCEEFREELLNTPITDVVLDISPLKPTEAQQGSATGLTRTWTDCDGNSLGAGTLAGLERSYIVIQDESGNRQLIPMSRLSDGDLAVVTEYWALPTECTLGCYPFEGRCWADNCVLWTASSLCHKPLYFENIQLERYGHTHGPVVQPFHSAAHFFVSLALWPYQTGIHPPTECQYALGYYRPGDCAPWLKEPFPISLHGAARQAGFVVGSAAILP